MRAPGNTGITVALILAGLAGAATTGAAANLSAAPAAAMPSAAGDSDWLKRSDQLATQFATELGAIYPERASELGLNQFDRSATAWSLETESRYRAFLESWRRILGERQAREADVNFRLDLELLKGYVDRLLEGSRLEENAIPFRKATDAIYGNIFSLVNPQSSPESKAAAPERFRRYVGGGALEAWQAITRRKMAERPGGQWASRAEVEDYLKNSPLYVDGIADMLKEAGCSCEAELAAFRKQVASYDEFVRNEVLPRSRENPRLPREQYLHQLRMNGVEWAPETLMARARADYDRLLPEFLALARQIGEKRGLPPDKRTPHDVSAALRADHVAGADDLLKFARKTVSHVEELVRANNLITLPAWPATVRLSTPAENAASPYVHVNTPPPLGGHAQKPEYVFPVTAEGQALDDDSNYWAGAVTLAAHEARPGHELQFSRLIAEGSRTRVAFGDSAANAEGWAVYVENLLLPYYNDPEARYGALQSILFRTARAFLDPMVQLGQTDEKTVMKTLAGELGLAESFVGGEYARYSWRWPGQATAYYYGMRELLDMKAVLAGKLGPRFSERWFNDSVVSAGPMPYGKLCERLLTGP